MFIFVHLVVGIFLNERNSFRRARLNRALEWLWVAESVDIWISTTGAIKCATYLIVPEVGSNSGMISTPFSTTFEMLNTASDMATDIQTDASARWRPG
jgi:hypothetical protein